MVMAGISVSGMHIHNLGAPEVCPVFGSIQQSCTSDLQSAQLSYFFAPPVQRSRFQLLSCLVVRQYAWGHDELLVAADGSLKEGGHNWLHMGLTITDSLDTFLLLGMQKVPRSFVQHHM